MNIVSHNPSQGYVNLDAVGVRHDRILLALAMIASCIVEPRIIAGRRCVLVIRRAGGIS